MGLQNVQNQEHPKKVKFIDLYFNINELNDFGIFISKFEKLQVGSRYSILFRVCFGEVAQFKMLGNQIGFHVSDLALKIELLKNLQSNILLRLDSSMLDYSYTGDEVITVQLLAYEIGFTHDIVKSPKSLFSLKALGLNKDLVDTTIDKTNLGYNKLLPLTMDLSDYNKKLIELKSTNSNGAISSVSFNEKSLDFTSLINQNIAQHYKKNDKITLDLSTKLFCDPDYKYIITLEVNYDHGYPNHNINIYTPNGELVLNVLDKKIDNTCFSRKVKNIINIITNKVITNTRLELKLDSIKKPVTPSKLRNYISNSEFIGTLDLETYNDNEVSKVYAAGFYTKQFGLERFYIDKDNLDSDSLVIKCIDSMLITKYNNYTFYVHNFSKFDSAFIVKSL